MSYFYSSLHFFFLFFLKFICVLLFMQLQEYIFSFLTCDYEKGYRLQQRSLARRQVHCHVPSADRQSLGAFQDRQSCASKAPPFFPSFLLHHTHTPTCPRCQVTHLSTPKKKGLLHTTRLSSFFRCSPGKNLNLCFLRIFKTRLKLRQTSVSWDIEYRFLFEFLLP